MPSLRILIVGGGTADLALGRALREQGVVPKLSSVRVVANAAEEPS